MTDEKIYVSSDSTGQFNFIKTDTNAQVVINKAIQYAYNNKYTTVHIKSGIYTINNPIEVYSGITLEGDGVGKTVIKLVKDAALDTKSLFYIIPSMRNPQHGADTIMVPLIWAVGSTANKCVGANDVIFHDIEVDVNYDNNAQIRLGRGYFNVIQLYNSKNIEIYNMYMHDGHGDGVRIVNSANVIVHDCKFVKLGHEPVFFIRSDNCHHYNNTVAIRTNSGGRCNDCTNSSIHNNEVWAWNPKDWSAGGPGFQIERQYKAAISVEVYNNTIHDTYGCGIWCARNAKAIAESGKSNVYIHDNIFYNCGLNYSIYYQGAVVVDGIHNVRFENNVVDGCYGHGVVTMGMTDSTKPSVKVTTYVRNNIITNTLKRIYQPNGTGYAICNRYGSSAVIIASNNCVFNNISGNYKNASSSNDITVDPLFVDRDAYNYNLKVNSPCIKAGVDGKNIGLNIESVSQPDTPVIVTPIDPVTPEEPVTPIDDTPVLKSKTIYPLYNNRIRETTPNNVLKIDTFIDVGAIGSNKYRSILYFDLEEFDNINVTKATLSLYWYHPANVKRANDTVVEIYRSFPYTPGYVSWKYRKQNIAWTKVGGNWYDKNDTINGNAPFESKIFTNTTVPNNQYCTFDVTDFVKKCADNTISNTGLLIKDKNESNNYIAFYNGNIPATNKKVKLTIEYE
jgi:hypothetical protein